jgi:(1->4)-alpha-D-glucan 1-alpha-D-glucosylmutase
VVQRLARRAVVGELVDQRVNEEVASSYLDVWGKEKPIEPEVRAALLKAMGPARKARAVELEAGRCYQPEMLERQRLWGFMTQLYGLRSERNWGIGDFTDLRTLIEISAGLGAAVVGVNPLHATQGSPYSPSSRHALNVLYIDVEAVPGYQPSPKLQKRLQALRDAELVDYEAVRRIKLDALESIFKKKAPRVKLPTQGLRDFAVFEALREKHGGGWQSWPEAFQDPDSPEVKAFAKKHAKRVAFHAWLQWTARQQLDAAQRHAHELGMPLGLYVDLALGADRGGAEVWSDQDAYAVGASCGAPPDEFNPRGQDWGLPPYSPRALRAKAYRPFIDLLRANMPHGGALRMDHVMALSRLWWIPQGEKPERGGYVHYPFRELLAILASESRRARCLVIGEDLGTVTAEMRAALTDAGVLSYRPLLFEHKPSKDYPREALVCVTTHDLPTWPGYWAAHDLHLRKRLGLTVDFDKELQARENDKEKLGRVLKGEGLDLSTRSAHAFIARTPCKLAMLQPEDVLEMLDQANLPGTVDEHPNWRRKLPLALERWSAEPRVAELGALMAERSIARGAPQTVPVATYRFQFHKGFRFKDAIALVPYLAGLGVSHLYASPFLKARPGSTHGYDVIDHNQVNPEIGTEAELNQLIKKLKTHGLGMILDLVPNHMGVLHADNAWWLDVLEKGRASPYARFFDIDWARGKLLLPVLGKHYGEALEAGELKVEREKSGDRRGSWSVRYFDHRFPLNAKSQRGLKTPPKDSLALHQLLEKQYYRLSYWRVASDEINYRRFFEITDLAGVRIEERAVFEATHGLVSRLAKGSGKLAKGGGGIDGVRIDHPDGLADPKQYFDRLAERFPRRWVLIEKILAEHESLPEDWPVHGETGYRFASLLTGVYVDTNAESRVDRLYRRFTGERRSFAEIARESRWLIMATTLAAELHMLSNWLARIAAGSRFTRDYTASGLRKALAEIAAQFPVYRTYVSPRGVSETDRQVIDGAVRAAKRASRIADPSVFDFVRSVLLLENVPPGKRKDEMLRFSMRYQQFTAPVVAKGVEDTAFYRYNRLIALNEVGGHPASFGLPLKEFHAAAGERARRWPYTMLASSTHDTKRSEDVRARLGVLSEVASGWRKTLRRWSVLNQSDHPPSRSDEYHFYQALVGIWPGEVSDDLVARLKAYMLKAAREAKERTSWINPDTDYEAALEAFVERSLKNAEFVADLKTNVARVVHVGLLVGLSQALVKVASPGVPDYYQGTELWDFSLVDPDNRRPVDYGAREKLLESLKGAHASPRQMLQNLEDGRAKLHVIRKGLEVRRKFPALFHGASYTPLYADAGREENVLAFSLGDGKDTVVAVAPRLFAGLMAADDLAPLGAKAWADAKIVPGIEGEFLDVLTGETHRGRELRIADALASFPVALLVAQ